MVQLRRQLGGDLDNVVAKALQAAPERRYASAVAFAEDLQRYLARQPILARKPSLSYQAARFLQRQRVPAVVAGVSLVALATVGLQAWQQHQVARQNQTRAETVDGLLQSLFQGMSPDVAASRNFNAHELLDRAQTYLDSRADVDPDTRRAARLRMAALYRDIGAYKESLALFQAEATEADKAHDPTARAMALWQVTNVFNALGDFDAAAKALQTLRSVMDAGHVVSNDMPARLELLQGELALLTNDIKQALAALARADALLNQGGAADLELAGRIAHDRGMAARLAGDIHEAKAFFERAVALQGQRGEGASIDRLRATLQIGALDNWSGRFKEALAILLPAQAAPPDLRTLGATMPPTGSKPASRCIAETASRPSPSCVACCLPGNVKTGASPSPPSPCAARMRRPCCVWAA
jgi:serine/threonine-protein kinase